MSDYLPILVMAALVVAFVMLSFIASQLLAPQRPNSAKQAPYECGIVPEQEPAEQTSRQEQARQHLRMALQENPNCERARDLLASLESSGPTRGTVEIQFDAGQ